MGDQDVGDNLQGDRLQSWVTLGEAVEEERQVLFSEILSCMSVGDSENHLR